MSVLTFANVDYESMVTRFNQKKSAGRSAHAAVVTPLNNELLRLIGNPKDENDLKERIFNLPHTGTARKHLSRWVTLVGIYFIFDEESGWRSGETPGVFFLAVVQSDENDYLSSKTYLASFRQNRLKREHNGHVSEHIGVIMHPMSVLPRV